MSDTEQLLKNLIDDSCEFVSLDTAITEISNLIRNKNHNVVAFSFLVPAAGAWNFAYQHPAALMWAHTDEGVLVGPAKSVSVALNKSNVPAVPLIVTQSKADGDLLPDQPEGNDVSVVESPHQEEGVESPVPLLWVLIVNELGGTYGEDVDAQAAELRSHFATY